MKRLGLAVYVVAFWCACPHPALSGDLPPSDRPIEEAVDGAIDARLREAGVHAASEADDATVVRRLTLDLVGRIPTAAEARAYVESPDPDKKARLVDRLMDSPGFVRHQADTLDAMLMAGMKASLRPYLVRALGEKRPWDRIFRELVTGEEAGADRRDADDFLKARAKDLDRLTSDVSSVFFGVNVSCAKCHDHPKVKDWKQDHYFGLKSFLDRTYTAGEFVGERDFGVVKFRTTEGVEKQAQFLFLTGRVVEVPGGESSAEDRKAEKKRIDEAKAKKLPPPAPRFSARAKLVEIALEPGGREFFAKAIANRLWGQFFGRGLVMPLDQMHSANPPSHPELLDWLARDLVEHGYDLRRVIKGLVLSHAYARTSRWESGEAPDAKLFAFAAVRPLTPTQLAASMWVAATDPAILDADPKKTEALADHARNLASDIARPGEDYQIGASEALLMSNGDRLGELLGEGGDRLVGRLLKVADRRQRIDLAVRNVLSRPPDDEEAALLGEYLAGREDRPAEGCRQLVWALLTDAEFRFNY